MESEINSHMGLGLKIRRVYVVDIFNLYVEKIDKYRHMVE